MAPKIESYEFGRIVIDGRSYTSDVIITPAGVTPDWWRKDGHSLHPDDLASALEGAKPSVFIMGRGHDGVLTVPEKTRKWMEDRGIKLIALPSREAVKRYNELCESGDVMAGLHLTC